MEDSGLTLWGVLLGLAAVLAVALGAAGGVYTDARRRGAARWAVMWAAGALAFPPVALPLYVWRVYHAPEADGRIILPWTRCLLYLGATIWVTMIPLVLILALMAALLLGLGLDDALMDDIVVMLGVQSLILGTFVIAWTYAFRQLVDRRDPASLGTPLNLRDAVLGQGAGVLLGATSVGIVVAALWLLGHAALVWKPTSDGLLQLAVLVIPLYIAAFMEEIVMRGYVQRTVFAARGHIAAVLLSSLPFALLHAGNPNLSVLGLVNIALIGVFFSLTVIRTGTLWFAAGFHVAWNMTLGPVLAVPVSGMEFTGLFHTSMRGPDWLTGGGFGIEASAICTVLFVLMIAAAGLACALGTKFHEPHDETLEPAAVLRAHGQQ